MRVESHPRGRAGQLPRAIAAAGGICDFTDLAADASVRSP